MYKMAKVFLLLLSFLGYQRTISLTIKNQSYRLEIAQTILQQAKGLSNRKFLCSNCGMIFPFSSESIHPFWMKDTSIPLDIIWLNQQGRVVSIITGKPNDTTIIQNTSPAKFVIELNTSDSQKLNLAIGDTINIPNL